MYIMYKMLIYHIQVHLVCSKILSFKELAELAEICQSSDPDFRPSLEMIVDKLG